MLYDTHAHLNLAAFDSDYADLLKDADADKIIINNAGTQKETSRRALELAREFKNVYAVVGLHPAHTIASGADEQEGIFEKPEREFDYNYYHELASDPKVVGIGECGLDYYRIPESLTLEQACRIQSEAFNKQIDLAVEMNKTLVIHCRATKGTFNAYDDVIRILQSRPSLPRFEIHSYTANWEYCQKFLGLGAYIGLNGIITFDKTGTLLEVVQNCPLDRIVLETDAPYLAPLPYRGKRNLPQYVEHVAKYIAEKRGMAFEEVASQTTDNSEKLFKIEASS